MNNEMFDTSGKIIQRERVVWRVSDTALLAYDLDNLESGEEIRLTSDTRKMSIVHKRKAGARERKEKAKWGRNFAFGRTLAEDILRRWEELDRNESPTLNLYVPRRNDSFKFRMSRETPRGASGRDEIGAEILVSLKPVNWVVRKLVPKLEFWFRVSPEGTPVLERYIGTSPVESGDFEEKKVRVFFSRS